MAMERMAVTSLAAVTTGTGNWFAVNDAEWAGVDCVFATGTSAGVVTVESTNDPDTAAATRALATINYNDANPTFGEQPLYSFIRPRITTTVTGGTVTVYVIKKVPVTHSANA